MAVLTLESLSIDPGQEHVAPTLLRLSVGIEQLEDLWDDPLSLEQLLAWTARPPRSPQEKLAKQKIGDLLLDLTAVLRGR